MQPESLIIVITHISRVLSPPSVIPSTTPHSYFYTALEIQWTRGARIQAHNLVWPSHCGLWPIPLPHPATLKDVSCQQHWMMGPCALRGKLLVPSLRNWSSAISTGQSTLRAPEALRASLQKCGEHTHPTHGRIFFLTLQHRREGLLPFWLSLLSSLN